jgi:hypothetical protein
LFFLEKYHPTGEEVLKYKELAISILVRIHNEIKIKADIDKLFAPGAPDTATYLLDRELNRVSVNQASFAFTAEFGMPLPQHNDNFEALMKFYNAFKANFN